MTMRLPRYEAVLKLKGRRKAFPVRSAFAGAPGGRWLGTVTFDSGLPKGRIIGRPAELLLGDRRLPILITRLAHRPDTIDFEVISDGHAR